MEEAEAKRGEITSEDQRLELLFSKCVLLPLPVVFGMETLNFTPGVPEIILEVHKVKNTFIVIIKPYLPFLSYTLKYRGVFQRLHAINTTNSMKKQT